MTYFQIQDANANVLDLPAVGANSLTFSSNEQKDSQFWYLHKQPNTGDYGFIGSKRYFDTYRVLTTVLGKTVDHNGEDKLYIIGGMLICNHFNYQIL